MTMPEPDDFVFGSAEISSPSSLPEFCQSSITLSDGAIIRMLFFPVAAKRLITPSPVNVLPVPVPFVNNIPYPFGTAKRVSALNTSSCWASVRMGSVSRILSRPGLCSFLSALSCATLAAARSSPLSASSSRIVAASGSMGSPSTPASPLPIASLSPASLSAATGPVWPVYID